MNSSRPARAIVDDVFGRDTTREIWSGNYFKAIPITVQDFDLTAVLPAVFYMFRFSHRRGKGKFLDVFGEPISGRKQGKKAATIEEVARRVRQNRQFWEICCSAFAWKMPRKHLVAGSRFSVLHRRTTWLVG
jgi:hypothetical protein